ncbi:ABC transporter permease subunit [Vibrio caribbeanicus]|uniref:ABC transporter permease subunit n=1 Tax=Vibrio caribbeanicus TaxID=701175 RepID=UPI0030DA8E95
MNDAEFSLRERDQKRLIQDKLIRFAVSTGGISVLVALVLLFVYLFFMVIPLFSDASIKLKETYSFDIVDKTIAIGVGDHGEAAFTLSNQGKVQFWSLSNPKAQPILSKAIIDGGDVLVHATTVDGWYGVADTKGNISFFQPQFSYRRVDGQSRPAPHIEYYRTDLGFTNLGKALRNFTFSRQKTLTVASFYQDSSVEVRWRNGSELETYQFDQKFPNLEQLVLTPDGQTLYLRTQSELVVAQKDQSRFVIREVVDLSQGKPERAVKNISLLSGAYSLLVTHQDGNVSQWFDVLASGQRTLTYIRNFELPSELVLLLPDVYRKGFYSFYLNGTIQSYYTTSEELVLFKRLYNKAPQLAAMSNNESFLVSLRDNQLTLAEINNAFPEVSLSSLWQKVWYEGYPEPRYVWQTTPSSDTSEVKFSLVPIAFGTLKAAAFAMLFAIPIAVLGAIYTAYFMSPSMRRLIKPSIELMEALPTVIIGFLAGLWFAPLLERHLAAVMALIIMLPITMLAVGAFWQVLPKKWTGFFSSGWHVIILMPALILISMFILAQSGNIETLLFAGDVRVFLAEHGIDFDQRNALVVGFAMGFAIIPTIFTIAEDAIFSVPKHLSDGSLALGATPWQTLIHVVLLTASPGIFSAIMMGLGRAVGETMIVLMATGNTPIMDWNILEGMRTLSATIAVEMPESSIGSSHYRILFLAALLLLVFTFAVNSLAEWVRQRLREKYRSL